MSHPVQPAAGVTTSGATSSGATSTGSSSTGSGATGASEGRSLGEIVSDITTDLSTLMRQEIDLAKTELKEEATKAGKGAGMLAGAGVAGHLMLVFLSIALMWLLGRVMDLDLAALVTALVWAVVAGVLALMGKKALQSANPALPETQRSVKEDVQWAKQQKS